MPRRLEAAERKSNALTLDEINQRLMSAAEKRAQRISKQSLSAKDDLEKVLLIRERRYSEDRATEERAAAELTTRLQTAEEKRQE